MDKLTPLDLSVIDLLGMIGVYHPTTGPAIITCRNLVAKGLAEEVCIGGYALTELGKETFR